jgi:hypothetical protein
MEKDQLVYNRLIEVACEGKVIPVCEVSGLLNLDLDCPQGWADINLILNDISCQENAAGRPLLSAVAVLPDIGFPAMGFFRLARELGVNRCCDERSFFYAELKRVHRYWEKHIPASEVFRIMLLNLYKAQSQPK